MKSFTLLFCAFLFSGAMTALHAATKSQQIERYLGTFRYKNDRPLGTVKFIFQQAVLKRQGDGKKTYELLLFNERLFSNRDNAGKLIGIEIIRHGKTTLIRRESAKDPEEVEAPQEIPKTRTVRSKSKLALEEGLVQGQTDAGEQPRATRSRPVVESALQSSRRVENAQIVPVRASLSLPAPDPVRPRSREKPDGGGSGLSMPDSSTIAHNIDNAKREITGWKGKMWQTVLPVWEFVMWLFSSLIIMLVCFAGICRYVAKTAANESLINTYGRVIVGRWIVSAHQNAAAMLLMITWVIAIVLLIDVFMWLVFLSLPIWTLLVIWFPILWLAEKLTSWIVPNIPVVDARK